MNEHKRIVIMWTARILPLIGLSVALGFFLFSGRTLTVDDVLDYTPSEPLLAALFLWLGFALKSLSMVFPIYVLFAVSGQLFPLPIALAVSTVGTAISMTLPYLLGYASELDFSDRLMEKYPKLAELRTLRENSSFFLSFLSRAIGILASDVVSMYFGSTRMKYVPYITGGLLGYMPDLICATILGQQIEDYRSPGFWIVVTINATCCLGGILLYRWYRKRAIS